jgi:hypothetical protein
MASKPDDGATDLAITDEEKREREAYALVGELVLIATAVDSVVNRVVIELLNLGSAGLLEPVIATLESNRKIEIIRERANHIGNAQWKAPLKRFAKKAEKISTYRNMAANWRLITETPLKLKPYAAAKMFKNLDVSKKQLTGLTVTDIAPVILTARTLIAEDGPNILSNLRRLNEEFARRHPPKG